MDTKQLQKIVERQLYLRSIADIEYWCELFKSTEQEFWQHHLWVWAIKHNVIDYIPVGIGDIDYSEGMRFEE